MQSQLPAARSQEMNEGKQQMSKKKECVMKLSPCLNCSRRNQNKNHPVCRDCNKRVQYVHSLEEKLNFTASYGDNPPSEPRISYLSKDITTLSPHGDSIY
jgi:hypothetical protein